MLEDNIIITVQHPTKGHRTFKVHQAKSMQNRRIISLLTGSENEAPSSWTGFGFVGGGPLQKKRIHLWKKNQASELFNSYQKILENPELYPSLVFHTSKICRRCGRLLTTPESIEAGIGPECAKKE